MHDFIVTVLAFGLALGLLIAVHEFGHYWVARRTGVKVLRFSIGFGKPLASWRGGPDKIEYSVSAIPLGGYVKMLDEREGEVAPEERHRAFNRQPLAKRAAIVAAGPVFNFLFAIFAYWLMYTTGVPGMKAILGDVDGASLAAQAGLHGGEQIVAVDGEPTPTWNAVFDSLMPKALRREGAKLSVLHDGTEFSTFLALDQLQGEVSPDVLTAQVGLKPYRPLIKAVVGELVPDSPAEAAGMQVGDEVLAIDGQPVKDWDGLVNTVQAQPGTLLHFSVRRAGQTRSLDIRPAAVATDKGTVGRIGAGVKLDRAQFSSLRAEQRFGPFAALGEAIYKTWDMGSLTLRMLGEMLVGNASVDNISGPITIARYAKDSAEAGLSSFLSFLAIVSVSLGVLNLLPIPVLDGGHLLFYVVEWVKGSPVSERTEVLGQKFGLALILALMTVAFYNDLVRLAG